MANENTQLITLQDQKSPLVVSLFYRLIQDFEYGQITLTVGDRHYVAYGKKPGPAAQIGFPNAIRVLRKVWADGALGIAESYIDGDWESNDITNLLSWGAQNLESLQHLKKHSILKHAIGRLRHILRSNTRIGSRRNIAAHYDLGNEFYQLWLDESMTYSSAIFDNPSERLADAQERKYARLINKLDAQQGDHILEIGCGWGGFAEYAAKRGVLVTGVTLSREQLAYARQRIKRANLENLVELRLQDYRDVTESYDHIVSIEMFEAVGEAYWPTYFDTLNHRLKPGGKAALQVITIHEEAFELYRKRADFIQRYIFPGGMLPSPSIFNQHAEYAGLDIMEQESFGHDYAITLMKWHQQFNMRIHDVKSQGFSDEFIRTWKFYLSYCEAGFRQGHIDLYQTILQKPADPDL